MPIMVVWINKFDIACIARWDVLADRTSERSIIGFTVTKIYSQDKLWKGCQEQVKFYFSFEGLQEIWWRRFSFDQSGKLFHVHAAATGYAQWIVM